MIKWFKRNKEEILSAYSIGITVLAIVFAMFMVLFMVMSNDLSSRIISQENEIIELNTTIENITYERNECAYQLDQTNQLYEDVVPLWQYVYDIEYLESVIRELRGQE